MAAPAARLVAICLAPLLPARPAYALPKILCLHGGGMSAAAFEGTPSVAALEAQLGSQFEFVYGQTPEAGGVWVRDAPGGKGAGTTDADWARASVEYLDSLVASCGPFAGILGYSQGSAFATYYLSQRQTAASAPFQFAMLFCGYLPTVHAGLMGGIDAASPFHGIPALVFMGVGDFIIENAMTQAQAGKFTDPTVITSPSAGHDLPAAGSSELAQVVAWAGNYAGGGGAADNANATCPSVSVSSGAAKAVTTTFLVAIGYHLAVTL